MLGVLQLFRNLMGPPLYQPVLGTRPWVAVLLGVALFICYSALQACFGLGLALALFRNLPDSTAVVAGFLAATLPASLVTLALAWKLASLGGANSRSVLALHRPPLTMPAIVVLIILFMLTVFAISALVSWALGINPEDYIPKSDGSSPDSGSAGLVKEAMFALRQSPFQYALAVSGAIFGAPLAEEVIFRGQLFAGLSETRVGRSGAVIISSALWALAHITEPWFDIGSIFIMGVLLGLLLLRFGSLYVTMLCHGVWNGIISLIIFSGISG